MHGARGFAILFETGQYGRLYIVSSSHARGKMFRVYVLPDGEAAKPNGMSNGPINKDAVEVYGVVGGNLGWDECYGWIHKGPWQDDFNRLVETRRNEIAEKERQTESERQDRLDAQSKRVSEILSQYK